VTTNQDISEAFAEFADLLELTGANAFKVNAFRRASRACEGESNDLAAWAREDPSRLRGIAGIGESTARHIVELVTTSEIPDLVALRTSVPAGLPPLLTLQGLGPKTVRVLWETLGITSLSELAKAIDEGRLDGVPRMGAKTIANLKSSVDARIAAGNAPLRHRLGEAVPMAEAILATLAALKGTVRTAYAGSARRGRETVGDLDLLVSSTDPERVKATFVSLPSVARVLANGETRCSVELARGVQVDLRVVNDDAFGAALLYFTGSKDHNVRLRERAIARGMHLNEYGLFRAGSRDGELGERVAAATEESIYTALELPMWPPELRESAALDATPPGGLLALSDIRAELHAHTTASDGELSLVELAEAAKARGFHTLAVTDHSKASAQANGLSVERLLKHIDSIREAESRVGGIRLLAGSEVDILADGRLDYDDETLAKLDIVVASPHTALRQPPEVATARLLAAIRHPLVHILGHPTGRIIQGREGLSPDIAALCAAAREARTALEINSHWMRLDLRDVHVHAAVTAGCLIAIDCDVHSASDFDNLRYGVATARRGGTPAAACVNSWDATSLLKWLASKR
jgi:DNA polymerase (family 10)